MKSFIIILIFLSFCGEALNAQTYTKVSNVKTPNNSIVQDTWKLTSSDIVYTPAQIAALAADLNSNYNGAELVEAPSYKYNCHAYAWHVSEGGDKVWMGRYTDDAEDIYWTDDSYIEVPEKIATKVSYHRDGNHSAIRLNSNLYEPKWGWGGPLVKHGPNDVFSIYQPAKTKKYYVRKPSLSGPSSICDQATYTIESLLQGATVRWSIKEGLNRGFSTSPQGVLSASVQTAIYGAPIVIQAAIEYPGTPEIKLTKSISTMPEKISFSVNATYMSGNYVSPQLLHVTISGVSYDICPPGQYRYMVNGHPAVGYENGMTVDLSSSEIRSDFYLALQDYPPDFISSGELELKILFTPRNPNSQSVFGTNGCIIANMRRSFTFSLSPNPATDEVTLQLMETDEVSGLSVLSTERSTYEIQLWSGMTMLRSFRTNEPTFQIPMAGLPAGLYFVRVIKDGQTYTQKLIKK